MLITLKKILSDEQGLHMILQMKALQIFSPQKRLQRRAQSEDVKTEEPAEDAT